MNNSKKHSLIKEFAATFVVCILFVFALCLLVQLDLLYRSEQKINFEELNTKNLSKFCTIEELEKKISKDKSNHLLYLQLAAVYESLGKLDKAKEHYQEALKLSNRSDFSLYSYALFCANHDLFIYAATLAEELSLNNKKTNEYKAKIYEKIADNLDRANNPEAALKAYQIVYKYSKNQGDKDFFEKIREKYAIAYTRLADFYIENEEIDEAVFALNNSLKIKDNPLAKYKLGLIYEENDKKKAEKYLHDAFFDNPFVVNPYIYNSLLSRLIVEAKQSGDENSRSFYTLRQNAFKKKMIASYLFKEDLWISKSSIILRKKRFSGNKQYFISFDLKNLTENNLENLYLKIELFVNNKHCELNKKIVSKSNPVSYKDGNVNFKIELPKEIEFSNLVENNETTIRYFARKTPKSPWILLKIDSLNF